MDSFLHALLPKIPEPTVLDRMVSYFSPERGVARFKARCALAMAQGWTGASKNKRSLREWFAGTGSADNDTLYDLPTLRARSRDMQRNQPLARGAINTKVTNVVGSGLKLQSCICHEALGMTEEEADAWERGVEREFALWAESQNCDAERTLAFDELQELAFRSVLENGDVFVLMPYIERKGTPYQLVIQLIEADRVSNTGNAADTDTLAAGVEKDAATGAPTGYHFLNQHPGAIQPKTQEWTKVPAYGATTGRRNVLHLYHKLRIGQSRGVPDLAPVVEALRQLSEYTNAELMAAVISACFTVFLKTDDGTGLPSGQGSGIDPNEYKMGPGAVLPLRSTEDVIFANPGRPNQAMDPFLQAILRQVGVALELPYEVLVKHFTASYSAARAALIEAWKFFSARRKWLATYFCQPIYEEWLTEAVALGRIHAPGFLSGDPAIRKAYLGAEWIGPARGQIDEKKEVDAAIERVNAGFSTIEQEAAAMGHGDFESIHRQRVKEVRLRREAGLEQAAMPANQQQASLPDPQSDKGDAENE